MNEGYSLTILFKVSLPVKLVIMPGELDTILWKSNK